MASPVDTTVKWARSTMPGAPVLTRAAVSLLALTDAVLVDGWGAQTATSVVVSGGIAEATFATDHAAAPHSVVHVSGVTGLLADLNGEQKVVAAKANAIRWATALPDGTAAGTVVIKMAAAGWEKVFSGTNKAAYRSTKPGAHGQFVRVDDSAIGQARVVGYENMSDIDTGVGPFPTNAQVSGGNYWLKSSADSGNPSAPWAFASNGKTFYFFVQPILEYFGPSYPACSMFGFGDMHSVRASGDMFATVLMGGVDVLNTHALGNMLKGSANSTMSVPRGVNGTGTAARGLTSPLFEIPELIYPNKVTGAFTASPIHYRDSADANLRAWLPGITLASEQFSEKSGAKTFTVMGGGGPQRARLYVAYSTNMAAQQNFKACLVDITGPWEL